MRDLETVTVTISDPDSRLLFEEAIRAYQAGAHRSAIISVWIAVSIDLIGKVRHLSDTGDLQARKAVDTLDQAIESNDVRGLQTFENGLLALCHEKLQVITNRELLELRRLYDDRNLCAHPAFSDLGERYAPSSEQVRAHLAAACDAVLSQPAVAGKQLLSTFMAEIIGDSWPEDDLEEYLRTKYFGRSRASVQSNLAQIIVKGCIEPPEGNNTNARNCIQTARALFEINPTLFTTALSNVLTKREQSNNLKDEALVRFVGAFGTFDIAWKQFPSTARIRLIALLDRAETSFLRQERFFASGRPVDTEVATLYESAIADLSEKELDEQIKRPYPKDQWLNPSLRYLSASPNFRAAEENMRRVLKTVDESTPCIAASIETAVLANDQIRLASAMPDLFLNAFETSRDTPESAHEWRRVAEALAAKHRKADPDDPDGYYSYPDLRAAMTPPVT